MSEALVLIDKSEGIATLTLNRPRAMNALRPLRGAIVQAFNDLRDDLDTGVVILTGAGKAFCAGLDLKEIGGETGAPSDHESAVARADSVGAMRTFDRPIIGAINGFAITGGFELALACDPRDRVDQRAFCRHARAGWSGARMGLESEAVAGDRHLSSKEISLTGNYLSAQQAEAWGLVNHVVPPRNCSAHLPAIGEGYPVVRS